MKTVKFLGSALIGLLITTGIGALLAVSWYRANLQPVGKGSIETTVFVVPKGQSAKSILKRLQEERLIQSAKAAEFYLFFTDDTDRLQAGSFKLSPNQSTPEVLDTLRHGTLDVWVTIPEGWRAEQVVDELQKTGFFQDIPPETLYSLFRNEEGRLFPDTYLFARTSTPEQIVKRMTDTFDEKVRTLTDQPVSAKGTSDVPKGRSASGGDVFRPKADPPLAETHQLILASLIEREAKHTEDRPLIAGVLENRIRLGMPLQVDATLQYAAANANLKSQISNLKEFNWWPTITVQDKQIDSPYNTYLHAGLPPGPISNPGLPSLEAAFNPASHDFLYYLSEPDGTTHYATTLEEHNANIAKYLK